MSNAIKAGIAYFAVVFGIGFVLGTLRVLVAAPRMGELASVLIELPIILTAAWIVCRRLVLRYAVPGRLPLRLAMGGVAFALLVFAELVLSVALFGNSIDQHLHAYGSPPGALGLVGQVVFAAFPWMQLGVQR